MVITWLGFSKKVKMQETLIVVKITLCTKNSHRELSTARVLRSFLKMENWWTQSSFLVKMYIVQWQP